MMNNIPKISVLVITYNQEHEIERAINSLLQQREYIYEICVSDDCSQDKTWEKLQAYSSQYPGLFVLNRNNSNIGIFENIEKSWEMPTGDIIYRLAGDDECGNGWLKKVVEFIEEKRIDYKKELFCIYGDYEVAYPNGDKLLKKNKAIVSGIDPLRLAFRQTISNRSACYSIQILKKFQKKSKGRSHVSENIIDRELQIFSQTNYYVPSVGNIYYGRIGVSVHLTEEAKLERLKIWPYTLDCLSDMGIRLSKKDHYFIKYCIERSAYVYHCNKRRPLHLLLYFLLGLDLRIFFAGNSLRNYFFAIRRRLPHKRAINM